MILWSGLILLLVAAVLLALVASRRPTPSKPGNHWLIIPVVVLVAIAIVFAVAGGWASVPSLGFRIAAVVLLLAIGVVGGSPLVLVVLELAGSGAVPLGDHGGILVSEAGTRSGARPQDREILRGGMTIGYLERLAIIGAALAGQYAAVAIVVAVKGLGRFSELENAAARERFIIGTLVSIVWAAACVAPAVIDW
ncbi:hypothetical protein E3N84_02245 [Terrimesophilobacter mesophilus]|uniref:Uncharacterized protein n=1 Tax=Terrimesophilobacter mesophilus TaxID=433647 RepID=A0A4R8VBL8_9MICO|nr:hypothetical protein E3N84_02245 [Terrimesophilobacter mesophilus]